MSQTLQTQIEQEKESLSDKISSLFEQIGELYVSGYGSNSWGCTQSTETTNVSWTFKYSSDDCEVNFVCGTYRYEEPVFEMNQFTYQMERQGTEQKQQDVYIVSQYDPENAWDILHISQDLVDCVNNYLSDLTKFNAHPDDIETLLEQNPELSTSIEAVKDAIKSYHKTVENLNSVLTMENIVDGIKNEYDDLCAIGICDDESDKDSIWKLFNCVSKDKNGIQSTNRTIHFQNDEIALVEAERWYDGWYSVAYVVGEDDGDTPFFIHRLQNADDIKDVDNWTAKKVYNLMGFDSNFNEDEIENDKRYRIQGDVYFKKRELDSEVNSAIDIYKRNVVGESVQDCAEEFIEAQDATEYFNINPYFTVRVNNIEREPVLQWVDEFKTDKLKEIQSELNITESSVRDEQDERGWNRLSQKRRRKIVRDLFEDRLYQWAHETHNIETNKIMQDAENEQRERYLQTEKSCPISLGNHLINIRNATIHPNSNRRLEEDIEVCVPEETQLFVLHDEHNSKILTIPAGIYTFGFLNQHFNS